MKTDKYSAEVMAAYDVVSEIFDDVFRNEKETEDHAQWLIALLKKLNAKKILDAAAGTGEQAIRLWQSGCFEVIVANDLNGPMIERFKEKLSKLNINLEKAWKGAGQLPHFGLMQCDWAELNSELPSKSFDVILCLGIAFYHLITKERIVETLGKWHDLLKPGGFILLDYSGDHGEIASRLRSGSFAPEPWKWTVGEYTGRSGKNYVSTHGIQYIPCPDSPLGWRSFNTWIIGELAADRQVGKMWKLSTGGAVLDMETIKELADGIGFKITSPPISSTQLYVQAGEILLHKT